MRAYTTNKEIGLKPDASKCLYLLFCVISCIIFECQFLRQYQYKRYLLAGFSENVLAIYCPVRRDAVYVLEIYQRIKKPAASKFKLNSLEKGGKRFRRNIDKYFSDYNVLHLRR
jgi:hypothetical protein